jgi:hypothetical protein
MTRRHPQVRSETIGARARTQDYFRIEMATATVRDVHIGSGHHQAQRRPCFVHMCFSPPLISSATCGLS